MFTFYPPRHAPSGGVGVHSKFSTDWMGRRRFHGDVAVLRRSATEKELLLVVDPTVLFVVLPMNNNNNNGRKDDSKRGVIVSSSPLQGVIATAMDGKWLHVAVKHSEDIGVVAKNGNMALRFDSAGTSLVAHQYIERCRTSHRNKITEQVSSYFEACKLNPLSSSTHNQNNKDYKSDDVSSQDANSIPNNTDVE